MQSKTHLLLIVCSAIAPSAHAFVVADQQLSRDRYCAQTSSSITTHMVKKVKFTVNEDLAGSISSDGIFQGRAKKDRPASSKLGVPSRQKKKASSENKAVNTRKSNSKLSKKERQRTGNGNVDSTLSTLIAAPEKEEIQVLEAKRGAKSVTIVR